ncbi:MULTISPECIES: hypothetical protein [Sporosarcina]|uniref:hypothetical protein n=1 Tax=Sporosarcina TaxID=1569 RepID=UPI000B328161|nr:hypothetical protein [Sporosarcina psychrophila]
MQSTRKVVEGKVIFYMVVIKEINVEAMWITVDSPFGRGRMPVEDIIGVECVE